MFTKEEFDCIKDNEVFKLRCTLYGNKETIRCMKEDSDTVFIFKKNSSTRGWRRNVANLFDKDEFSLVKGRSKNSNWHRQLKIVIKKLEKSGLWPQLLERYRNLDKMELDEVHDIARLDEFINHPYLRNKDTTAEEIEAAKNKLNAYLKKYPFIVITDENGKTSIDYGYLWHYEIKTVKMTFGTDSSYELKRIKDALDKKESMKVYRTHIGKRYYPYDYPTTQEYESSFEYNAEENVAFYNEEYEGCGNGYYYYAIDETTALLAEKD